MSGAEAPGLIADKEKHLILDTTPAPLALAWN